jgi:hypothetical protein
MSFQEPPSGDGSFISRYPGAASRENVLIDHVLPDGIAVERT